MRTNRCEGIDGMLAKVKLGNEVVALGLKPRVNESGPRGKEEGGELERSWLNFTLTAEQLYLK